MISWLEKHSKLSLILALALAILIFYLSSKTFSPSVGGKAGINAILYHLVIFFLLSFFLSISILQGKNKIFILMAISMAVLYALSDELHQFFVPGRSFALFDIFLDSFAILSASIFYLTTILYREVYPAHSDF